MSRSPSPSPKLHNIGSLSMCIAVDKSGSTWGSTLKEEFRVIDELRNLRQDPNDQPVTILPWCDQVETPIVVDKHCGLPAVESDGGTNPSVLYGSNRCLSALRESGIWVLMTDGQIQDSLVEDFATRTADVGLHNKATIIIVFGETRQGRPAVCDISVGIAIYAVVPDCLFLFHDTNTGIVRIMQAKGRFKQLIPVVGQQRPKVIINQYTHWAELPKISYKDIFNVEVNLIRPLGRDEMALENGLIVNVPEILSGNVDDANKEQIFKDRDNLRSLTLASKTRGTGKGLAYWLKSQQKPAVEKDTILKDVRNRALHAITNLLEGLRSGASVDSLEDLREQVRFAHESNLSDFWAAKAQAKEEMKNIKRRNVRLQAHTYALEASDDEQSSSKQAYDGGLRYTAERSSYLTDSDQEEMLSTPPRKILPSPYSILRKKKIPKRKRSRSSTRNEQDEASESESLLSVDGNSEPMMLPGYRRPNAENEFRGRCMLCHSTSTLTFLLKSPPSTRTEGFPPQGKKAKLAFPLAMGSFAEMDVLSSFITCDACAYHLIQIGTCPNSDIIIGALCLVCLPENQGLWCESVDNAVKGRFDIADLLAICMAIVETKLVENENRTAPSHERDLFRECSEWALRNLALVMEVPNTLSPAFSNGPTSPMMNLESLLVSEQFTEPEGDRNASLLLLRYPVSGFVVLMKVLRLLGFPPEREEALIFQKLIFEIIEKFLMLQAASRPPKPVAEFLGLSGKMARLSMSSDFDPYNMPKEASVLLSGLVQSGALDEGLLKQLETCPAFEAVGSRGGPAITVFLHVLMHNRQLSSDAVSYFKACKQLPALKGIMQAPLSVTSSFAEQLVSQM